MRKVRSVFSVAGILLLILSAAMGYVSIKNRSAILPAESYEDKGVYTFLPYQVLPVQVENTGAVGRSRRTNPTRTVYMVYYRTADGSGYQWTDEADSRERGQEIVDAGAAVERRVLSIPADRTYITVEPDQSAESYTALLRRRCDFIVGLAVLYILFYIIVQAVLFVWKRLRERSREQDEFVPSGRGAAALVGPELQVIKPRLWERLRLWLVLPLLLVGFVGLTLRDGGADGSEKLDHNWDGSVWTCGALGLRYTLPVGGERYDLGQVNADREAELGPQKSAGQVILAVCDEAEGSTLTLTAALVSQPAETEILRSVEAFALQTAQGGVYDLEDLGEETLAGQPWSAWRIETPERGLVHYYLCRQSGAFWLILTSYGPMAETPAALLTRFEGETSFEPTPANAYLPPANEEGYLVATFPPALLGNETPEELVDSFREDLASTDGMTREELEAAIYWSDVVANGDGSVSYYFTPEQYQRTKKMYYLWGTRVIDEEVFGFNPSDIVKRLEYSDVDERGVPWAVTAWVDQAYFQNGGTFSSFVASFVPMTIIGRYQIICGVPAEEWAVHVTVRNADTEEVIAEGDFGAGEARGENADGAAGG